MTPGIARLLFVTLLAVVPPVGAQGVPRAASVDSVLAPTVRHLRRVLGDLARADRELMPSDGTSTLRAADDAVLERRAIARARIDAGIDTLLASGAPGRAAIRSLAADWPGVDQVRRAEVRAALRAGDARDALHVVERLAVPAPRDTQLLSWRIEALESLRRPAEALRMRQSRFELVPNDPGAWRPLLAAHEAAGSLPQLRESLGRLRLLFPDSRIVRDHEIEVLHRLGRVEEAARIAADTSGSTP